MTQPLDETDKALVAEVQRQFPMDHRPFQILGLKLGISEQQCLERMTRLKAGGVVREVTAHFDARALGYRGCLVVMKVDPAHVDEAAGVIGRHPGVWHCETRRDAFNLWFAVGVSPRDSIDQVVRILHTLSRADETLRLPRVRLYKAAGGGDAPRLEASLDAQEASEDLAAAPPLLSDGDIRFIRVVQEDLPLLEIPYAVWAAQAETAEQDLFGWMRKMAYLGSMRRFAAVLDPRETRRRFTETVVWDVPGPRVDEAGERIAAFRDISHCSRRPTYPSWPYALLTTLQTASPSAAMETLGRIGQAVGGLPNKRLSCVKEHKHARLRYFPVELEAWQADAG